MACSGVRLDVSVRHLWIEGRMKSLKNLTKIMSEKMPQVPSVEVEPLLHGSAEIGTEDVNFSMIEGDEKSVRILGDDIVISTEVVHVDLNSDEMQESLDMLAKAGVIDGGYEFEGRPSGEEDRHGNPELYWYLNKPLKIQISKLNEALEEGRLKLEITVGKNKKLFGRFHLPTKRTTK